MTLLERTTRSLERVERALAQHAGWVTLAVFVVALAPRLWVALAWAREPVWDGHYYHFGAQRIAEGVGYGDSRPGPDGTPIFHPWCHYPVGYSAFLAGLYALFGDAPSVATVGGALVGAATAVVVHRLALAFLSPLRALLAAAACALHPGLIVYAALVMTEPLAAFGLLAAPLAFVALRARPRVAAVVGGVLLGLATLVRPQSILLAPALVLLAVDLRWRQRIVVAALAGGAAILTVLPWTARNCAVMDGCAFVSTNGGWNLAIGSSPRATGRFEALRAEDGCRVVTGQVQQDQCWRERGVAWIREDPRRWLALVPKKLSFTFDHQSFAVGYLSQAEPDAWPEERRAAWRHLLSGVQVALLALAALAVVPRPTGRRDAWRTALGVAAVGALLAEGLAREPVRAWPLAVLALALAAPYRRLAGGVVGYALLTLASLVVVHAVFFGEDRYQIVATPALCLLLGAALRPWPTPAVPSRS